MCTFVFMAQKLRIKNSGFVRISNKAIKIAKSNKKRTGVSIGKFIEELIYASIKDRFPILPGNMKEGKDFTLDKESGTITIFNS